MEESILNKFFDKIFCITCFEYKDRQKSCQNQFSKYNIDFQWVISTDKSLLNFNKKISVGEMSLFTSHERCFQQAKMCGYKKFCIFEDDFLLHDDWESRFGLFIKDLPEQWDMLYLGEADWIKYVFPTIEKEYNENCSLCVYGCASHFMGFNESVYDKIIGIEKDYPIDVKYNQLQLEKKTYMPAKKRLADAASLPHEKYYNKIPNFDKTKYMPSTLRLESLSA